MIPREDLVAAAKLVAGEYDLAIERVTDSGKARLHDTLTAMRPYVIDLPLHGELAELREIMSEAAARMRGIALLQLFTKRWIFTELDAGQRELLGIAAQRLRIEDDDSNTLDLVATWVAGDGTDSQRVAIADGIRSRLWDAPATEAGPIYSNPSVRPYQLVPKWCVSHRTRTCRQYGCDRP